jgi:hypothetical protein
MNAYRTRLAITVALWITIALAGFATAVWQLWNWLLPDLFHVPEIGYWQACGLLGLCWLLFGGWRWSGLPSRSTVPDRALGDDEREALRRMIAARQERSEVR